MIDAVAVVLTFNEAINGRNLDTLAELITESHRFVDSSGATLEGKTACVKAWRELFDSFPDYLNIFDVVTDVGHDVVVVQGRSQCSFSPLDGPAEWRAVVLDARVDEWQVSEPAPSVD